MNNSLNEAFTPMIRELFLPIISELLEEQMKDLSDRLISEISFKKVVTDKDLREMFSISQPYIQKLKHTKSFPNEWMGIQGHYKTNEILEWFDSDDGSEFRALLMLERYAKAI